MRGVSTEGPYLVTGGLGFVGSAVARRLADEGAEVRVLDNRLAGSGAHRLNLEGYEDRIAIHDGDVRDAELTAELIEGVHGVFHCATHTSHLGSMENPLLDLDVNTRGTLTLLEGCRRIAPEARLVYPGTRQVYGKPRRLPVDETHPIRPPDVNGINQYAAEGFFRLYNDVYGLRGTVLRLSNVYGPGMRIRDARQMFVGIWIRLALEGGTIRVFGDGSQLRDVVFIDDVVDAILAAARADASACSTYNVGRPDPISLIDLAEKVVEIAGSGTVELAEFPSDRKAIAIGDYYSDVTRIGSELGWAPKVSPESGLERTIEHYRTRLAEYVEGAA